MEGCRCESLIREQHDQSTKKINKDDKTSINKSEAQLVKSDDWWGKRTLTNIRYQQHSEVLNKNSE